MKYQIVSDDFWDLTKLEAGTIVYDASSRWQPHGLLSRWQDFRLLIMKGPAVTWCCYIGVSLRSPLAGLSYSDSLVSEFECHGGLTFAGYGDDGIRPGGWYYFGWDYGHYGDWVPYISHSDTARRWTFGEVRHDIDEGLLRMKEIESMKLYSASKFMPKFTSRKRLIRINGAEGLLRMKEIESTKLYFASKFMNGKLVSLNLELPKFTSYRKRLIRVNGAE